MWGRKQSRRGIESLRARRRRARLRFSIELIVLALVIVGASLWLLSQPYLRVSKIEIAGADQSLASYAEAAMRGTWLGIIPKDSIVFIPEGAMRRAIFADHPEIAALAISRASFSALSIRVTNRVAVARWCGSTPSPQAGSACYLFDGNGYIFSAVPESASTTPPETLNAFAVYDALIASSSDPLRNTLASADQLPDVFAFARKFANLGSPAESVVIRNDEVDIYLRGPSTAPGVGTRITYVLGQEQATYSALTSALKDLNLSDGSIAYIDLRFPGDVYVKKAGQ